MRIHPPILFGSFVTVLLTGCVGYNHTFFMTKSNAGLDFDSKPPTAEINIARKEVVVAPTFEGGQTPPVLASFKPHTGFGSGFQNFFVGVDQTFAGGDPAKTMAMAYDSPKLAPQLTNSPGLSNSDSTIRLSQKPKYTSAFKRLPGPGAITPLIFATDTSLGLKVAWSGAGGAFPDTVKLGFNRKEFAWAPLTMTQNTNDTNTPYEVRMPAFLATIQSRTDANLRTNGTSGIAALQYFATGDAATWLARQYPVRQAMIERIDPMAAAIAVEDSYLRDPFGDCLRGYWKPDGANVDTNNAALITKWMQTNSLNTSSITIFLRGSSYKELRKKAVTDLNVNCDN